MSSFANLVAKSSGHAWLFMPSAILLGALHGLEPGHSKTMMTAFIVAIRGTLVQAVAMLSVHRISARFPWLNVLARRAPYVSSLLIVAVGVYAGIQGWVGFAKEATPQLSTLPIL